MSTANNASLLASLDFEPAGEGQPTTAPEPTSAAQKGPDSLTVSTASHGREKSPEVQEEDAASPPASLSASITAQPNFSPMKPGKIRGLEDSPSNRKEEAARWARAQADMIEKGRIVENMRNGRFKAPERRKSISGGDVIRDGGFPIWGKRDAHAKQKGPIFQYERPVKIPERADPFQSVATRNKKLQELAKADKTASKASARPGSPKPLTMAPRSAKAPPGARNGGQGRPTPAPTAGPSGMRATEEWPPLAPVPRAHDEDDGKSATSEERDFPRMDRRPLPPLRGFGEPAGRVRARRESLARPHLPLDRKSAKAESCRASTEQEEFNEAAARRIQAELWAEERAYNRSRRSQSQAADGDDPMDEDDVEDEHASAPEDDDVFDDEADGPDVIVRDSGDEQDTRARRDSFDEVSDIQSVVSGYEQEPILNIEPAIGDDRAKAGARADIFADTQARVRWSQIICEPIDGMTQDKLLASIDPAQIRQFEDGARDSDDLFVGFVHAIGGTRSADIDRVTVVNALDAMIALTCRRGTEVTFSPARQDPHGPALRPGTVLIETADKELDALWQESPHWAQAGVRWTVQKYKRPHSAFMVTVEGTRRNRQAVEQGMKIAARTLPLLTSVFRDYNVKYPGKGRGARNNFINSITARPMSLKTRRGLGFGSVQFNLYARLKERNPDPATRYFTGEDEIDGYPPLTDEMHRRIRIAFKGITSRDDKLGDASPINPAWDCGSCTSESHPIGKCDLKDIEGWFKSYEEFAAANSGGANKRDGGKIDRKGKGKAAAGPRAPQAKFGGAAAGGSGKGGPSRSAPHRRAGGN
ncbi:hypothetical protein AURDEDRAFT_126839 [Auricularia subglabra TFB-10046 SS5]|nr:hypothetical protein AURDEDRAFT_126839 [Auricularia subglabra TFB-10046 SS5]